MAGCIHYVYPRGRQVISRGDDKNLSEKERGMWYFFKPRGGY
jgi:hypothetical protein